MARRSPGGCLPLLALLVSPCVIGYGALALASPALVPYLYLHDQAQFAADRHTWYASLAAAPVLAFLLVRLSSPADGRLRARRDRSPVPRQRGPLRARRPHPIRGYLDRVVFLLGGTSATTLWLLLSGDDLRGPGTLALVGGVTATVAVAVVSIRYWDRPYTAPVTVETVRAHHRRAQKELRRVRGDNQRVTRMIAKLEVKLADAQSRRDFAVLQNLHHESYGCADSVYAHYRSVESSLGVVTQMVRTVRVSSWQPAGVAVRAVNRKARVAFIELRTETGGLAGTAGELRAEWLRNRDLVQSLNARTADLKCQIRDGCGPAGIRWYEALEARRDAARAAEGKPAAARR
ncbi:hypothetical protein OHA21_06170 [Actinoplanes sp. NBC_00393]|uniref:hypothetical protein n=1 Tax=Actinoplanes sp. NBC_00393 TaxID=2975953 RepID=UPI002E1AB3FA